jgi:hypothetical protein
VSISRLLGLPVPGKGSLLPYGPCKVSRKTLQGKITSCSGNADSKGDHAFGCNTKAISQTKRHNAITYGLMRAIYSERPTGTGSGYGTGLNPKPAYEYDAALDKNGLPMRPNLSDKDRMEAMDRRPDVLIFNPANGNAQFIDTSVIHTSYRHASKPGSAAEERYTEKYKSYNTLFGEGIKPLQTTGNGALVNLVVESGGALHPLALAFINDVALTVHPGELSPEGVRSDPGGWRKGFRRRMLQVISVELQKGNAKILMDWRNARLAPPLPPSVAVGHWRPLSALKAEHEDAPGGE